MKLEFLKGKKTYLVALAMFMTALIGALSAGCGAGAPPTAECTVNVQTFLANLDWQLVLNAIGLGTLRAGVAKVGA